MRKNRNNRMLLRNGLFFGLICMLSLAFVVKTNAVMATDIDDIMLNNQLYENFIANQNADLTTGEGTTAAEDTTSSKRAMLEIKWYLDGEPNNGVDLFAHTVIEYDDYRGELTSENCGLRVVAGAAYKITITPDIGYQILSVEGNLEGVFVEGTTKLVVYAMSTHNSSRLLFTPFVQGQSAHLMKMGGFANYEIVVDGKSYELPENCRIPNLEVGAAYEIKVTPKAAYNFDGVVIGSLSGVLQEGTNRIELAFSLKNDAGNGQNAAGGQNTTDNGQSTTDKGNVIENNTSWTGIDVNIYLDGELFESRDYFGKMKTKVGDTEYYAYIHSWVSDFDPGFTYSIEIEPDYGYKLDKVEGLLSGTVIKGVSHIKLYFKRDAGTTRLSFNEYVEGRPNPVGEYTPAEYEILINGVLFEMPESKRFSVLPGSSYELRVKPNFGYEFDGTSTSITGIVAPGSNLIELNFSFYNPDPGADPKVDKTFDITKYNFVVTPAEAEYTGHEIRPSVTAEGLVETLQYLVSYSNNTEVGTGIITITGIGLYEGTVVKEFTIVPKKETEVSTTPEVIAAPEDEEYDDDIDELDHTEEENNPYLMMNQEYSISKNRYVYSGKACKPTVTVKGLTKGKDYTVTYANNKNIGTGKVLVTGIGDYEGSMVLEFAIVPKGTSISKVTCKKTSIKVTYAKQAKQTSGYEIKASTSKKFTKSTTKTVDVDSYKTTSATVSKLKSNKTYYVKIRTYKIVNGIKVYSDWSDVQKVKTRK